jgi:hypothetical protein
VVRSISDLNAGEPFDLDSAAGVVAPELDELLDGEDARQVLYVPSPLIVPARVVDCNVLGEPSDPGCNGIQVRRESLSAPIFVLSVMTFPLPDSFSTSLFPARPGRVWTIVSTFF